MRLYLYSSGTLQTNTRLNNLGSHLFHVKAYQMDLKAKCRDPIIASNANEDGPRNGAEIYCLEDHRP